MKQPGFFDAGERFARLGGLGDQLQEFSRTVDLKVFRPDLDKALAYVDGMIPSTDLAIPSFGYKSHISIDRLIRKWKAIDAAASDGARSRGVILDRRNTASDVWADTSRDQVLANRSSDPVSSMSLLTRHHGRDCLFGQWISPVPPSGSGWPISSTTCAALCS